jgi:hypothetical protein
VVPRPPSARAQYLLLAALTLSACVIESSNSNPGCSAPSAGSGGNGVSQPPPPNCSLVASAPALGGGALPTEPAGPVPQQGGSTVFAITHFYYGDSDRSGNASSCAWASFGLNIDRKTTSATSTDVCTLVVGASTQVQIDGVEGIDNSFGENVLPALEEVDDTFISRSTSDLTNGGATTLVRVDNLGTGASNALLPGMLYRAVATTSPASWDGGDVRAVDTLSLVGGSVSSPLLAFPKGYMNDRVWVGAPASGQGPLELHLSLDKAPVSPLVVTHAQVAMTVDPSNASASGVISGVLTVQGILTWARQLAGSISTSLCGGSAFQSIASQIEQMADIMTDGSNEPGRTCDGISIGIGFDAKAVKLGSVVTEPVVDTCADAATE